MDAAKDEEILARAVEEDRIVVSADSDFSAILAAHEAERLSFILFRDPNLLVAHDYIDVLLSVLPALESELMSGCVAVFSKRPPASPRAAVLVKDSTNRLRSGIVIATTTRM